MLYFKKVPICVCILEYFCHSLYADYPFLKDISCSRLLEKARVTPTLKSGDKNNLNNYLPISILPTISQIFEIHIAKQFHAFLRQPMLFTNFNLSPPTFMSDCINSLVDDWLSSIDFGQYVGAVFLYVSKAFDLVDHRVLLYKLKLYHYTRTNVALFTSDLSERTQVVRGDNLTSTRRFVSCGVPPSSIIAPLLFILYINDLPMTVSGCGIYVYADDPTLYKAHKDIL